MVIGSSFQVSIQEGSAIFDFNGTAPARNDNLNATEAIVHSAICYCLRVLIGSKLPLNEGLLEPSQPRLRPGWFVCSTQPFLRMLLNLPV